MNTSVTRGTFVAFVIALGVMAGGAAADSDVDKGVVAVAYDGIPNKVHPVLILDIDGKLQPQPLRDVYYLEPGKHTLRLGVVLGDHANVLRGNPNRLPGGKLAKRVLEIDVEAGKRYLIGGKLEGRRATEWEPVIYRVEPRADEPAP